MVDVEAIPCPAGPAQVSVPHQNFFPQAGEAEAGAGLRGVADAAETGDPREGVATGAEEGFLDQGEG
jgi:hypothetical protein